MRERRRLGGHWGIAVCLGVLAVTGARPAAAVVTFAEHVYEFVPGLYTWEEARAAAAARIYEGAPGHLATITTAGEQAAVLSLLPSTPAWIGASDAATEGTWVWETGPEAGTVFWKDGAPVGGAYDGWRAGEPNDFQGEDHLSIYGGGWVDWDDIRMGFVVEHSFGAVGFAFAMADGRMGALRNESPPGARLERLDVALPSDTFFDSAPTPPGVEFGPWSVIAASGGATPLLPDSALTDGLQSASVGFSDLDPIEAILLHVDLDRVSAPDGGADVVGTQVTATFSTGDVLGGVVEAAPITILGVDYPYSVRVQRAPDWDVDGVPDASDVCPGVPDPAQADTGGVGGGSAPDGVGDACQCGDVSGDGRVTLLDAAVVLRALLTPPTATMVRPEHCDVGADGECTLADAVLLRRALLLPPTATLAPGCVPEGPP